MQTAQRAGAWSRAAAGALWLALAVLAAPAGARAQAPQRPLVVAFHQIAPWAVDAGDRPAGFYPELVRELARRLDLPVAFVPCPLKRCLALLADGQADLTYGLQQSPERARTLVWLKAPYRRATSDKVFYVAKGAAGRIRRYEDLTGLAIGTLIGSRYFTRFDADATLNKQAVNDNRQNFQKLAAGRLDAVIMAEDQAEYLIAAIGLSGHFDKADYRAVDGTPRSLALSRKSPLVQRLDAIDAAMAAMQADGTVKALIDKYYFQALGIPPSAIRVE